MIRGFSGSCNTRWRRVDVEDRRKAALNFSMVKRPCERRHHRSNGRLSLYRCQAMGVKVFVDFGSRKETLNFYD
jgi:hypothetical protein